MKIATWNLERVAPETPQADRQREWLQQINADIWVLTETDQAISPGPAYRSIASAQPDRPARQSERWVQIWVRQGTVRPIATADPARTACAAVQWQNGQNYLIYGTVLPWLESTWRTYDSRDAFAAALQLQQADWQRLMDSHPQVPLVVAGDFNQDLSDLPYYGSRRNKQALRRALAESQLDCLTDGDHDPVRRVTGGQHANIDHICGSGGRGVKLLESFAWPPQLNALRGVSDHFGVGVTVELSGR